MVENAHSRPRSAREEPLYDVNVPAPSHGERARTLVEGIGTGTLCTIGKEAAGYPYGSFVTVAFEGPSPVFLISELAEHTKNLRSDDRVSLLVAEGGEDDPLANGRVTLLGRCAPVSETDEGARAAYLARHPNASYYADFKDFRFWRLAVTSARYIGGYGRMSWVSGDDWSAAHADPLAPAVAGIVEHMNADHAEALLAYTHAFSRATDATEATMTGIDRYGFEMSVLTEAGRRPVRLAFEQTVTTPEAARHALIDLVKKARAAVG